MGHAYRHDNWCGSYRSKDKRCALCSMTGMRSFPPALIPCLRLENLEVILTPYRAPNANAFAKRWVRSVPEECLDHLFIFDERHLDHILPRVAQRDAGSA